MAWHRAMITYPKRKHFPIESIICCVEAWIWWLTAGIFCTRDQTNLPSRQLNAGTIDACSALNDDWIICVCTLHHIALIAHNQNSSTYFRRKKMEKNHESDSFTLPTVCHSLIALDIFAQFDFDDLFSRAMNKLFPIIQLRWLTPIFTDFNKSFSHPQFCSPFGTHSIVRYSHSSAFSINHTFISFRQL